MGCFASMPTNGTSPRPASEVNEKDIMKKIIIENSFHGRYLKGEELGKGGYSTVFEVIDRITKHRYAAKEIIRSKLLDEDEIGLRQEIEILRSLQHENIVQFIDFFEEKDHYYVVLELLEGGELFDRIVKKLCYSEKEARDLVFVLLNAIKFCHDRNVVHRDLKPENLLMASNDDDANVKIADFGFAKRAEGLSLLTQCGSPGYVAPEVLEHKPYGKPADMWSAGVITYIIIGGYPPFHDDKDQTALFRKIKKGIYEFHDDYWSHISEEAKELIRGLLTVDVTKRLTVDQALRHLWICRSDSELASRNLDANLKEFKKFLATRKFRAAAKAVIAIRRMSRSFSNGGGTGDDSPGRGGPSDAMVAAASAVATANALQHLNEHDEDNYNNNGTSNKNNGNSNNNKNNDNTKNNEEHQSKQESTTTTIEREPSTHLRTAEFIPTPRREAANHVVSAARRAK